MLMWRTLLTLGLTPKGGLSLLDFQDAADRLHGKVAVTGCGWSVTDYGRI